MRVLGGFGRQLHFKLLYYYDCYDYYLYYRYYRYYYYKKSRRKKPTTDQLRRRFTEPEGPESASRIWGSGFSVTG